MEHEPSFQGPGLVNMPPPPDARYFPNGFGAGAPLPAEYIVPVFRHWFNDDFQPQSDQVFTLSDGSFCVRNQGWLDRCVGEGCAFAKTSHEKVWISAKDAWAIAKRLDAENGYPRDAYGATVWAGMCAIKDGAASERLVDSEVGTLPRDQQMNESWVTDEVRRSRENNKGSDAYIVERTRFRETLYAVGHPIVTTVPGWYSSDHAISKDQPFMSGSPTGRNGGGHCFAYIGWIEYAGEFVDVFVNSYGPSWGWYGMFLLRESDRARLGLGHVHVDAAEETLAELLARYDGLDLRLENSPDHYRCELGVLRRYPDEITWWAHGKLFGRDTYDIPRVDFDRIPKGADMRIEDGPHRELVRQIRQHYGQL